MSIVTIPSVDVLRNRGIAVKVHVLNDDNTRAVDATGEFKYETAFFKFDNWSLANIESAPPLGFGSLEAWQEAMNTRPNLTTVVTVAHMRDKYVLDNPNPGLAPDVRYASRLMLDGEINSYAIAISNAMLLAQGTSPETVQNAVGKALKEYTRVMEKMAVEIDKALLEDNEEESITPTDHSESHPSSVGTKPGQPSEEVTTSSGS